MRNLILCQLDTLSCCRCEPLAKRVNSRPSLHPSSNLCRLCVIMAVVQSYKIMRRIWRNIEWTNKPFPSQFSQQFQYVGKDMKHDETLEAYCSIVPPTNCSKLLQFLVITMIIKSAITRVGNGFGARLKRLFNAYAKDL